jgi:hypothetical protein
MAHKRADVCGAEGDGAPERGEEGAGEHFGGGGSWYGPWAAV